MAGEIEETFSINFQTDSIHSGSISFGRFEKEPLSWERRSSFSHNRYLEEVEKCSKPGSVIEKKAYFEAHFKKKGLSGSISSVGYDGFDQTTSENDGSERIGNQEDFESNGDGHYLQFDERSQEDFEGNKNGHYIQLEQRSLEDFESNEDDHQVQFYESSVGSDYHGEYRVTGYEREDNSKEGPRVSFSNPHMESSTNNYNILENGIGINITLNETQQPANETGSTLSVNDEAIIEEKKNHDDNVNSDESLRTMNMTVTEPVGGVEETALDYPSSPSPKETTPEPGVSSVVNNLRVLKSTFARPSGFARDSSGENPRRTNKGRNSSKLATPTTHSMRRTAKEVSKSEEKLIRDSKSDKALRMKEAAESQPSVLKVDSRGIQEGKRMNRTVNSAKTDVKPRAAAFNFKCSERAERRKEFYMKLEEKMHAKEVELNKKQAISQEKTEAEIKELRKSLNFKATPMPSFYHSAVSPQSDGNKVISNKNKSRKVQNKPKCPGSIAGAAFPSNLKTGNDQVADESVTATKPHGMSVEKCPTDASEASLTSPSPSTNKSCLPDSKQIIRFPERRNEQRAPCKNRVSESCKEAKRKSNEGKKKGETPKRSHEMTRKGMRSIDVRSSSRIGNLTVRVAS